MARVLLRGSVYYSDFRFRGQRIQRALRDESGLPIRDQRRAIVALGQLIDRVRVEAAGGAHERYPWSELKRRALDVNEASKKSAGLRRDRSSFDVLERFFLREFRRALASPDDVTPEVLRRFIAARTVAGMKPGTIRREAGGIKAWMRRAHAWGLTKTAHDWAQVKLPKVGKRRPPHHSRADLAKLLRSLPEGRWRMIGWLGSRAGLRRAEMLHAEVSDVRLDRGVFSVVGKACTHCAGCRANGGRWEPKDVDERDVPLVSDIRAFLAAALPALRKRRWLLADASGHRPSLEELSTYFARLTRKAGLRGGVQTLRHTYGCHMVDDGVPTKTLQKWMGHESLVTTEQYLSVGKDDEAHVLKVRPLDL